MTILKALPLISQDLMKIVERRKNGKYRSEKNRKTVAIADMKDILRNYESEMDTEVEKALIYGLNLAIYNRLSDLTNEEFEEYIKSICSLIECQLSSSFNEETGTDTEEQQVMSTRMEYHEDPTTSTTRVTTNGTRRISSGMIPYRED